MTGENEGDYCTVCGGIKPEAIKTRTILVEGKATGINQLDTIIDGVRKLRRTMMPQSAPSSSGGPAPSTTYRRRRKKHTATP